MILDMEYIYICSVIPLSHLYVGPRRLVKKGIIIIIDNVFKVKLCEYVLITLHKNYETSLIKCHMVSHMWWL